MCIGTVKALARLRGCTISLEPSLFGYWENTKTSCDGSFFCLLVGQDFLHELAGPGTYDGGFKLKAVPDPDCDPTQQECEQWLPGVYTVHFGEFKIPTIFHT